MLATIFADGHTAQNAPDLFGPPSLSGAGSGQYWGGGTPGKPFWCCRLLSTALTLFRLLAWPSICQSRCLAFGTALGEMRNRFNFTEASRETAIFEGGPGSEPPGTISEPSPDLPFRFSETVISQSCPVVGTALNHVRNHIDFTEASRETAICDSRPPFNLYY